MATNAPFPFGEGRPMVVKKNKAFFFLFILKNRARFTLAPQGASFL